MTTTTTNVTDTHYEIDGRRYARLHHVLKCLGIIDDRWFQPEGARRGELVALATEKHDKGLLDGAKMEALRDAWGSLTGEPVEHLDGYLAAWKSWRTPLGEVPEQRIEEVFKHTFYGYATRPDRVYTCPACLDLVEIKTGQHQDWYWLQLAGQARAVESHPEFIGRRCIWHIVYLRPDGTHEHRQLAMKDVNEYRTWWLSCISCYNGGLQHGLYRDRNGRDPNAVEV